MITGTEKLVFSEKNLIHCHSAYHKILIEYSGIEPGPQR